jgi:2'-5' RNA ligase
MNAQRLFVGIGLPEAVRHDIATLMRRLEGVRWTPPENLHLTLRFLGDVDPERQQQMEAALAAVRVEPFVLPVEGVGVFPTRGPARVVWVGVGGAHTRLFQLRKQVDEALLTTDPAIDVRNFSPHITIGRLTEQHEPKHVMKFLETHARFEAPPFRVNEFQLFASDGGQAGAPPRYEIVRSFALEK